MQKQQFVHVHVNVSKFVNTVITSIYVKVCDVNGPVVRIVEQLSLDLLQHFSTQSFVK
jgi:hypothetical protein